MAGDSSRLRIGRAIRHSWQTRRWSQRHLAARAHLSASVVGSLERGEPGASLETIDRVAAALGLRVLIGLNEPFVEHVAPRGDAAHARCIAVLRRLLERTGLECAAEQPVLCANGRGWIDLLAFDHRCSRLDVIEVKTELRDLGALQRQVELYSVGCLSVARTRGWCVGDVAVVVVVLATAQVDEIASLNRMALAQAYPMRGHAVVVAILDGGPVRGRGLLAIDPLRSGRRMLTSLLIDGRRSPAPYCDYADFAARLRATRSRRVAGGAIPSSTQRLGPAAG